MAGAGIEVHLGRTGGGHPLPDQLDLVGRHVRVVLGEMQKERAAELAGLVEMLVDLHAVVAHRCTDLVPDARQVGELAAEAEAHHANLAGAFLPSCEGGDGVLEISGELVGVEARAQGLGLGAALVGVGEIRSWLLPPIDVGGQDGEAVGGVAVADRANVVVRIEHLWKQHDACGGRAGR